MAKKITVSLRPEEAQRLKVFVDESGRTASGAVRAGLRLLYAKEGFDAEAGKVAQAPQGA